MTKIKLANGSKIWVSGGPEKTWFRVQIRRHGWQETIMGESSYAFLEYIHEDVLASSYLGARLRAMWRHRSLKFWNFSPALHWNSEQCIL